MARLTAPLTDQEVPAALARDAEVAAAVAAEAAARSAALDALSTSVAGDLTAEASTRAAADTALQLAIDMASGGRINIFEFGAIADGNQHPLSERYGSLAAAQLAYPNVTGLALTDQIDWAAGEEARATVEAQGGGIVWLPPVDIDAGEAYVINKPWRQYQRSWFQGSGSASEIQTIGTGDVNGNIFQMGMHHPGHYTSFTYYSLDASAVGHDQITFTTPAEAANFTVGQVVLIRSNEFELSNGFEKPFFVELNRVRSIDATTGVVKLDHSFDEAVTNPKVTNMAGGSFAGMETFIADRCGVMDVGVDANQNWLGRNASYECYARNIYVKRSMGMVLGNAFGRCLFERIQGNFTMAFAELASGAHHSTFRSIWGSYKDEGHNVSTTSLVKIGEHVRHNAFEDYRIYAGAYAGNFGIRMQARKNSMRNGLVDASVSSTGVYMEGTSATYDTADLVADNEVSGDFYWSGHARALDFSSVSAADVHQPKRNVVKGKVFGTPSVEAFRGNIGQQNTVDVWFQNGAGRVNADFTGNTIRGHVPSWTGTVANLARNNAEVVPYRTAADTVKLDDKLEVAAPTAAGHAARKQEVDAEATARIAALANKADLVAGTVPDAQIPSSIARDTEVAAAVAALVDSSPGTLDTLNELAAALGDDPNFATTLTTALAGKEAVGVAAAGDALLDTRIDVLEADTNWVLPTLATDVTVSATWGHLGYRKRAGVVYIMHGLDIASAAANKLLYTLPAGFRPKADGAKVYVASLISGPIRIDPGGEVRLHTAVALSVGITSFPVDG